MKENLIIRPLNYSLHTADLKGYVYRKIGDFVLALYHRVGDANHKLMTSKIFRWEVEKWGVSEDQAIQDALENTARLYPASVYDKRTQQEEKFMEKEFTREDITMHLLQDILLLSAMNTPNGAVSIFYPGVIPKMMKIMGGPFQAVFMNINDVLIFDRTDRTAVNFLNQAKESSKMGEMLSSKLYLCDEEDFTFLLNELESILDEEAASFGTMPEGLQESGRGLESRNAQAYLQKAVKALREVTDKKNRRKMQELMDEVHANLRAV